MVLIGVDVPQQHGRVVDAVDGDVDFAIVENVAEARASARNDQGEASPFDGRHHFEFGTFQIVQEVGALRVGRTPLEPVGLGIDVAVDGEQVFPAIVIVIDELSAPGEERVSGAGDPHLRTDLGEVAFALVAIEGLVIVREGSGVEIEQSAVLEIAHGQAHRGRLATVLIQAEAG